MHSRSVSYQINIPFENFWDRLFSSSRNFSGIINSLTTFWYAKSNVSPYYIILCLLDRCYTHTAFLFHNQRSKWNYSHNVVDFVVSWIYFSEISVSTKLFCSEQMCMFHVRFAFLCQSSWRQLNFFLRNVRKGYATNEFCSSVRRYTRDR